MFDHALFERASSSDSYSLSMIVGFVSGLAPRGIPFRDGDFVGLPLSFVPVNKAVDAALAMRVWDAAFDVAVGLMGYMLFLRGRRGEV